MTEKNVRSVFENDPNITLKQGVELVGISEDAESVTITYKDEEGKEYQSKVLAYSCSC
jgi:2-polyprenyl-6-methoxyphenol hydroxylase-like FAD-dependent oxidoreductase